MKLIAEKRVVEVSEGNIETITSMFFVEPGETVEALLARLGLTGRSDWHYDMAEVRISLVK